MNTSLQTVFYHYLSADRLKKKKRTYLVGELKNGLMNEVGGILDGC